MHHWTSLTCRTNEGFRIRGIRRFNPKVFTINEIIISWVLRTKTGDPEILDSSLLSVLQNLNEAQNWVQQHAYGISNQIAG